MFILVRQAIMSTLMLALVLCAAYPAFISLVGSTVFPHQANGSLVIENNAIIGSELIGQNFTGAGYFHSRPSAAGETGYAAGASSGSNYGPTSKVLAERMQASAEQLRADQSTAKTPATVLPVDLLTASGSGLDPHISPDAALLQAPRVAAARHLSLAQVEQLIYAQIQGPEWGLWGEDRVNVLHLNKALRKLGEK